MISSRNIISSFRKKEAQREFSCITAPLPWDISGEILKWGRGNILERDLINDGFEDDIHVTVKYGIHDHDPFELRPIVKKFGAIHLTLGKTSLFENDEQDVVKISVESPDLIRLNKLISDKMEHTDSYPDYIPHITVAYVKPGRGKDYDNRSDFEGKKVVIEEVLFSGNDYRETIFQLK